MEKSIFTRIIDREIPAVFLHEDDRCVAFPDINAVAPTHVLVVPRKPVASLNELTPDDAELVGHLFVVAAAVMGRLGHRDYRTVFNCGAGAQQSVMHLHLHVLAGRAFTWPPG